MNLLMALPPCLSILSYSPLWCRPLLLLRAGVAVLLFGGDELVDELLLHGIVARVVCLWSLD